MKVLVTGGAGFIGSHLCEQLLHRGHSVTAADNFITGSPANIEHLSPMPAFDLIEQDVTKPLEACGWEAVFHLASPASPVDYSKRPIETMLVNSVGSYHLLELCRFSGARFLLTSTSEIYGDPAPSEHPQKETYWGNVNPVGPRACYDEAKRFAEALTISYLREYGLDARIVRIFNTYGPRNKPQDGRIIPNFVGQAISGEPITVFGDGLQTRSYCYVSDMVEGLIRAMFQEGIRGEIINLGNPDERTVLEMAQAIKRLSDSDSPIIHLPGREEEIARRQPDISKAQRLLGWRPSVSLETGLSETIAWFRAKLAP